MIDALADRNGVDTIDELHRLQALTAQFMVNVAEVLGISVEALENMVRDLRKKLAKFPDV